ncbi:MAG: type II toxin-antitoxin system HicB family antitoxin [Erysipelotrichaceae bacterium]|nr:type II toxin-antitoxin system HicB family antitoxin [Erysipelotrichaceae bacterium]
MLEKLIYPSIFLKEDDGITITFPDLPGCISCAYSYEEAYNNAKEVLELYLEDYVDSFPRPSKVEDIHLEKNEDIAHIELDMKSI